MNPFSIRKYICTLLVVFCCGSFLLAGIPAPVLLWQSSVREAEDTHIAFRGSFFATEDTEAEIQLCGASWYVVWLDGNYFSEGPDRYPARYPEYQRIHTHLAKGDHLLAIQVHYEGVDTRMLKAIQPFLFCRIMAGNTEIPVSWKCTRLEGYKSGVRRINNELGWIEWCDTRKNPSGWQKPDFSDINWDSPVAVARELGAMRPSSIGNVRSFVIHPDVMAEGQLAEFYGYELDNPSARFFLRNLTCNSVPPQGVWKRYDLGHVVLSRPEFLLDVPAGTVIEFAYSEDTVHGRVSPWITLSTSDSYNLDHYIARGGLQEFFPLTPKGGRFVEVHILAPPGQVRFVEEKFIERCYYDSPEASFRCSDSLLNRIWMTGIETYRACSEDALIDNPTRERGQWTGDVGIVGMEIGAAGYSDIRLCRRGLVQSARCARADGMVAGLCPGGEAYLSSYAAQWVPACLNYRRLTGDKSILEELYPAAEANMAAFRNYMTEDGINYKAGWAFIDWGYVRNEGPCDMGLNLHYYLALLDMVKWSEVLGKTEKVIEYKALADDLAAILSKWYAGYVTPTGYDWQKIGYHRTVLGLKAGFIPEKEKPGAIQFIKEHILNAFPNNLSAPRLSDPGASDPRVITPYFAHYVFPVLIENGAMDFVLDQYRKCWGWALETGLTTWPEVFDTRWSHCHQWAGCPTWQLSKYVLGLSPQFDVQKNRFRLTFHPGSLRYAEGKIPLPDGKQVYVSWHRNNNGIIEYRIETPEPIWLNIPEDSGLPKSGVVKIKDVFKINIKPTSGYYQDQRTK